MLAAIHTSIFLIILTLIIVRDTLFYTRGGTHFLRKELAI